MFFGVFLIRNILNVIYAGELIIFKKLSIIEVALITLPTLFGSIVLAISAVVSYRNSLSRGKIIECYENTPKNRKSSLKEWLVIIVGLTLYYVYHK